VFTARYVLRSAHKMYLCVLCGSQNKAIISLYSISITETECVYYAVRSGYLSSMDIDAGL